MFSIATALPMSFARAGAASPLPSTARAVRKLHANIGDRLPEGSSERVRQDDMAYRRCHDDAQADFGDARRGDVKGMARVQRARNAHDCGGVTRQDKAISGEVPHVLRAESA